MAEIKKENDKFLEKKTKGEEEEEDDYFTRELKIHEPIPK